MSLLHVEYEAAWENPSDVAMAESCKPAKNDQKIRFSAYLHLKLKK